MSPSTVFWQANTFGPRDQVTQEALGNGLVSNRAYDGVTGWVKSVQTGVGGGTACRTWSTPGTSSAISPSRKDKNQSNLTETFVYDNLYRLDYSQRNGVQNLDMCLRRARQHHEQVRCGHLHLSRHEEAPGGVDRSADELELRLRRQRQHDAAAAARRSIGRATTIRPASGWERPVRGRARTTLRSATRRIGSTGGRSPTTPAAARRPRSISAGCSRR